MNINPVLSVKIVDFSETKLAVLEHRGPPSLLDASVQTFIQWRKSIPSGFLSRDVYNLNYNDPETTNPDDYQVDIGILTADDVQPNPYGVITKTIAKGRCAVIRHIGSEMGLKITLDYLCHKWLPESKEVLRDAPCFFHRLNVCSELLEDEQIIDIYLPLK